MSTVKIGPKHQVTIPRDVFAQLYLKPGEFMEAIFEKGRIILIPKQLTNRISAPPLTGKEQNILFRAKRKIEKINKDILKSKGLTANEIKISCKVGLIDPEQSWWWAEKWQKGERKSAQEIREGKFKNFSGVNDLIKDLRS
ncbi:MAG: AbrB/MazE/SpoVT family DNA-binding domain-containing protein [Elusimicrobiota bacterium]|nr:AbrB/MazE/SpoVT family DNA-binding domain-containing protein [Elusimicrobiota bacterium]